MNDSILEDFTIYLLPVLRTPRLRDHRDEFSCWFVWSSLLLDLSCAAFSAPCLSSLWLTIQLRNQKLYNSYQPSLLHTNEQFIFCCVVFFRVGEGYFRNHQMRVGYGLDSRSVQYSVKKPSTLIWFTASDMKTLNVGISTGIPIGQRKVHNWNFRFP